MHSTTIPCNRVTVPHKHSQWQGLFVPVQHPLLPLGEDLVELSVQVLVDHLPLLLTPSTQEGSVHILLHLRGHVVLSRGGGGGRGWG